MSNRRNYQFTYTPHNKATLLDCSFIVDSTNANGLGIRSLQNSGRIASAFMNTSPVASASTTSVFSSGDTTLTLASVAGILPGMAVADSTTGGNISGGTTVLSVNAATNQIVLSAAAAGSSASSPGDTLTFTVTQAMTGNPNPDAGFIVLNLQDNYNKLFLSLASKIVPLTGSAILVASAGTVTGHVYVITVVGTTTAAGWQSLGLPKNIAPAVGVAFVATATTTASGTGAVQRPATNGTNIFDIVTVGNPNLMNSTGVNVLGAGNGMQIILACYKDSSGDNPVLAAPADNTTIALMLYMNDSAQGV